MAVRSRPKMRVVVPGVSIKVTHDNTVLIPGPSSCEVPTIGILKRADLQTLVRHSHVARIALPAIFCISLSGVKSVMIRCRGANEILDAVAIKIGDWKSSPDILIPSEIPSGRKVVNFGQEIDGRNRSRFGDEEVNILRPKAREIVQVVTIEVARNETRAVPSPRSLKVPASREGEFGHVKTLGGHDSILKPTLSITPLSHK